MKKLIDTLRTFLAPIGKAYRKIFSIHEIEEQKTLHWFFGAMLFYFFITFESWLSGTRITAEHADSAVCWPHYQNCEWLYFLSNLPNGYSHTTLYMALYAVMLLIVYCMYKRRWVAAHALLLVLFTWKMFVGLFLDYNILGMYDDYHLGLTAVLLFLPHKQYFAKLMFVLLYFISATIKFHPTWTLGTYFTSLQGGLPLFPDAIIPLVTGSVILEQIIGCWFLLSRNVVAQRIALAYFILFHLYSGILVQYNYPSATLPALIILFGPLYMYQRPPLSRRSIAGWLAMLALFALQVPSWRVDSDTLRITDANNRYGVWMFDANHQCVATIQFRYSPNVTKVASSSEVPRGTPCGSYECTTASRTFKDGDQWVREIRRESAVAWRRCDPYEKWKAYENFCASAESVSMQLDHSINGGPFYRIIDEKDICSLEYKLFGPNEWIKAPPEAPAVGIPVKNVYRYPGQYYVRDTKS